MSTARCQQLERWLVYTATYRCALVHLNDVVRRWESLVALSHILDGWLSGINDHGGPIDSPDDDTLVVRNDRTESYWKCLGLGGKSGTRNSVRNLGSGWRVSATSRSVGIWCRGRVGQGDVAVSKDSAPLAIIGALAVALCVRSKPVIASCVARIDDDIVTLT